MHFNWDESHWIFREPVPGTLQALNSDTLASNSITHTSLITTISPAFPQLDTSNVLYTITSNNILYITRPPPLLCSHPGYTTSHYHTPIPHTPQHTTAPSPHQLPPSRPTTPPPSLPHLCHPHPHHGTPHHQPTSTIPSTPYRHAATPRHIIFHRLHLLPLPPLHSTPQRPSSTPRHLHLSPCIPQHPAPPRHRHHACSQFGRDRRGLSSRRGSHSTVVVVLSVVAAASIT